MSTTMGDRIKTLREAAELSQEELGSRVGVKRAAIQKYEKGVVENIPIKTIEKLAGVLGVPPMYLLGWGSDTDSLNYELKIINGVKYFYGKPAVEVLEMFYSLTPTGQKRAAQYIADISKLYSKEV